MKEFDEALNAAINFCIENDVLKDFLTDNREEVKDILLAEYCEEIISQGINKEMTEENKKKIVQNLLGQGCSPDEVAQILGVSVEEVLKYAK